MIENESHQAVDTVPSEAATTAKPIFKREYLAKVCYRARRRRRGRLPTHTCNSRSIDAAGRMGIPPALDRLSREGVLPTLQHLNRLTSYGVAWRSYSEQFFDSCGPFPEAVISIMATLAQQDRIKRAERTKAGLARVRAAGRRLGPPRKLNGEHTAAITSLRSQGLSGREIARRLSISEGSVRRLSAAA
jgi:hypothetical protein